MDRDIADIKRTIERMASLLERVVTQTDQVEEELRLIRTALEKANVREEEKEKRNEDASKW